ncbi:ras-associating and dilute domain-containing protein-like isoform X3 [Apostichopus japonicus]
MLKILSNKTVQSLVPLLKEQLRLPPQQLDERLVIYQITGSDEILLSSEECPLEIAVNSHRNVTFEVKMATMKSGSSIESFSSLEISSGSSNRKALSNFFGVNENELAVAFSPSLSGKSLSGGSDFEPSTADEVSLHSSNSSNSLSESFSRLKKSPRLFSSNNGTGLWLRDKTPTFKRKGPLSLQPASSEKDLAQNGRQSPKRKTKNRSITALLENGLNLKKRQAEHGRGPAGSSDQDEGLFKLHANFPESGCTCRRVFVDKFSKAEDVVRDFLDLSSVSYDSYDDFVLCDVVGWYHSVANGNSAKTAGETKLMRRASVGWKEECFRTLDDKEHPLVVQSLWVPGSGRSRRFEIRRKTDIVQENGELAFFDLVNGQLERKSEMKWEQDYESITNASSGSQRSRLYCPTISELSVEKEDTESSDEHAVSSSLLAPRDRPYVVCIQGYSAEKDLLFHTLNKETLIVGNQLSARAEGSAMKAPDIQLHGPDVLLQHCILSCHHVTDLDSSSFSFDKFLVTLEPCSGGKVSLNGSPLDQEIELRPGDLVSVGSYYHFILRDASSKCQNLFGLRWMNSGLPEGDGIYSEFPHLAEEAEKYEGDTERWKVAYKVEHEDDLVDFMMSLLREEEGGNFGIASGHLFLMIVEFAAYTQGPDHTRTALLKVANALLEVAENKAREMATTHSNSSSKPSMESLAPDLKVLLIALANALELLNCLQTKLPDYLPPQEKDEDAQTEDNREAGCYQEVLSVLEEVVMYSFQQCVYYITKTLYDALPTILSANPFADGEESSGISNIISIFQGTFDLLNGVSTHPDIISQLYAYLLFFMNAALFNVLLEKAANGKYLRWSKGVQIRGNLDVIESWIMDKGLDGQIHFLQTMSSAADLLATPKIQLMQATWSSLRSDFSSLRPAQLHQLLSKYELSNSKKSPTGWTPIGEDVETVTQRETILETFDDHPPLTLPSEISKLDLYAFHNLPSFHRFLEYLRQDLPFVHVYQGVSRVSSRRQSQASNKSFKDQSIRKEFSPEPLKVKSPSPAKPETCKTHIYASVKFDEKSGVIKVDCNDNESDVKSPPPGLSKVSEDVSFEAKILDEKTVPPAPSKSGSKKFRKHKNRNKNPSSIKKTDKKKDGQHAQLKPVSSEEEASNLLQAYFSGVSGGYFDSIPEEEDDESSGVEDFPLLDDVPVSPSFKGKGKPVSSSDEAVASSEGSSGIKEEYHDTAVENFDPVKYAVGTTNNKAACQRSDSDQSSVSKSEKPSSSKDTKPSKTSSKRHRRGRRTSLDDVFVVDLVPENDQLGIRFADGMKTPLATPGVYIRGFTKDSVAVSCEQLKVGDRVLAVDGTSLVGFEYDQALEFITQTREKYRILVARSDPSSVMRLTAPITAI